MQTRQSAVLDTGRQVLAFLEAHATLIGPIVAPARRSLDDAVSQLASLATTQTSAAIAGKGATVRHHALESTLRNNYMKPVATVAKLMLRDVPEIGAIAVKTRGLGTTQLVSAAHGMADAAEPYASVLAANGLPGNFITLLRNAADAVTASVAGRKQVAATASSAVAGLKMQEARVRNLLALANALVIPTLGSDASLLAEWKSVRAITGRRAVTPVPGSITAAAATPTTVDAASNASNVSVGSQPSGSPNAVG
jgi:hypothetical protein